jgi:hypothetical protein
VAAAEAMTGNNPKDCIIVKAAPYPPARPTLIRKSRLLRLIFEPPYIFPNGRVRRFWMVELEFSGLLSMWEQSSAMAAPGALCVALMRKQLASALPCLTHEPAPGNQGGEMENDQSSTWKLVRQKRQRGKRGEGLRFDRENVHHP